MVGTLVAHVRTGDLPQFPINLEPQLGSGLRPARSPFREQARDFTGWRLLGHLRLPPRRGFDYFIVSDAFVPASMTFCQGGSPIDVFGRLPDLPAYSACKGE
jgi:hypothetical protein